MSESDNLNGGIIACDVLIVGAGFSGIASMYRARKAGLRVKVMEAGHELGGVWNWNRYPGARVDSEFPFYQLNIPEAYRGWSFSQRFPDHIELRKYMSHLDETLGLAKDIVFGASVVGAKYRDYRWTVRSAAGHVAQAKYLILASGLLHQRHFPGFPGLPDYKGAVHHSMNWPSKLVCKGKRVAIIGAGATAVQIVQALAKETAHGGSLVIFMRTPSYCLPMGQRTLPKAEEASWKAYFPALFTQGRKSFGGFPVSRPNCKVFDVSDQERQAFLEELWERGAFNFVAGNYNDLYLDPRANREIYDFWAKKARARMTDPAKQDLLAPLEPPYPFGTKRAPLEQDFYECVDMEHVEVVNLNHDPLKTFTASGIQTASRDMSFDIVIMATGFDSFTGSIMNMGITSKDGVDLKDIWKGGVTTYLGMMIKDFPNLFMVYSPHAPNVLSNGPTIIECQADLIMETISRLEVKGASSFEPTQLAQDNWKVIINAMSDKTLFPLTSSWWTGGNIPGKKAETLTFLAGIETYEQMCRERLDKWEGIEIS